MVFDMFRPHFVNDRPLARLIRQYQESVPTWHLNQICFSLEYAFKTHLLYHEYTHMEFSILYHNYPAGFIRKRMGWTVDPLVNGTGSWPLEFRFKVSFGLYRKYSYLDVLNVGLEPRTRVALPDSDKQAKILQQAREILKEHKKLRTEKN